MAGLLAAVNALSTDESSDDESVIQKPTPKPAAKTGNDKVSEAFKKAMAGDDKKTDPKPAAKKGNDKVSLAFKKAMANNNKEDVKKEDNEKKGGVIDKIKNKFKKGDKVSEALSKALAQSKFSDDDDEMDMVKPGQADKKTEQKLIEKIEDQNKKIEDARKVTEDLKRVQMEKKVSNTLKKAFDYIDEVHDENPNDPLHSYLPRPNVAPITIFEVNELRRQKQGFSCNNFERIILPPMSYYGNKTNRLLTCGAPEERRCNDMRKRARDWL